MVALRHKKQLFFRIKCFLTEMVLNHIQNKNSSLIFRIKLFQSLRFIFKSNMMNIYFQFGNSLS